MIIETKDFVLLNDRPLVWLPFVLQKCRPGGPFRPQLLCNLPTYIEIAAASGTAEPRDRVGGACILSRGV